MRRSLLDTQLLLWAVADDPRLPASVASAIRDPGAALAFSVVSIWETAIKVGLGKRGFVADPQRLRANLLAADLTELPVTGDHAVAVRGLPPIHRDPFDRLLLAQAMAEGLTLLTADTTLARYAGPVRLVT